MRGLLGIDLGTTRCKVGLFAPDGSPIRLATRPTETRRDPEDRPYHDPERLWQTVACAVREVVTGSPDGGVQAVGVASMAEAGLLVDRRTGRPCTPVIPWYDGRAAGQAEELARRDTPLELFRRSGLHPSYKYGLAKLRWLRERDPGITHNAVWLSVADYIVYRLTGTMATDPSLAARTYAYRIAEGVWDDAWIRDCGFDPALFPQVLPAGAPAGAVTAESASATGLPAGIPAAVAGHDHLCALLAAGIVEAGPVLDSIGTAESLLGVRDGRPEPGERELASGLSIVPHVLPGRFCWLGGLSSSGGSVEWLRSRLGEEPLSYERLGQLAAEAIPGPTGILYFPYLHGRGGPRRDRRARAAFVGLSDSHGRGDLIKAVLEGTAYEVESLRRSAEGLLGRPLQEVIAVGGGARNRCWVQIRADVSGCRHHVPAIPEATALGAALAAGLGSGALSGIGEVLAVAARCRERGETLDPDAERHARYRRLYEAAYLGFSESLGNLVV